MFYILLEKKSVFRLCFLVKYSDFLVKAKPIIILFQTMKLRLSDCHCFGLPFFLQIEFRMNSVSKTLPKGLRRSTLF